MSDIRNAQARTYAVLRLIAVLGLGCLPLSASAQTTPRALVLYDAPQSQPYAKLGLGYAIMLRNLLGHFDATVELSAVESYTPGRMEAYDSVFYIGSYYNNPVPLPFLADLVQTKRTVVWFKFNLWQLAWDPAYGFTQRHGFGFSGLRSLNAIPTADNPVPGFFDTVLYKGRSLVKYYAFDTASGTVRADPEVGVTQVTDAAKAQALVSIRNSRSGEDIPYVIRSGNFWYVADAPFTFIGPRDRYLVICDLLHDILGVNHAENHRAMVRLEDVSALTSHAAVKTLADYLWSQRIPFSIAAIPFFKDPLGRYFGGTATEVPLSEALNLKLSLDYALTLGGGIVMHGYTHQYDSIRNVHSGASGDDFEFWNAAENRPPDEDSEAWALSRVDAGLAEFARNGYAPFAWETPHYQASPIANKAVARRFATAYQRGVYYTSDNPRLGAGPDQDFSVGQFYPYIIESDYYGQRILPENLGNILYASSPSDAPYGWQDLYLNAQYALVVRDGFASFFFHPFLLDQAFSVSGFQDFKNLVEAITALGYTWANASTVR